MFPFLALFFVAQFSNGQENGTDKWTPEHSMKFKSIRSTKISPDGSRIAYVVREPLMDGEKSEYRSHIWMATAEGKMNFQFTQGEKSCSNPQFSPDGEWLAFTSSRSGKKSQIWLMRVRGGEAEKLTNAKNSAGNYAWSPDGKSIAYTMRDPESKDEEKAKKEKRDVILVNKNFKYSHLYTIAVAKNDSDKHDVQRLTAGNFHVSSFDWSPDGKTIAFSHAPDPRINTSFSMSDIASVPSDSGEVTQLVTWSGTDRSPNYSPDGKWIAFSSHGGTPQEIGLGDIYVIPAGGGAPKKLADTHDRSANILGWDKNSANIYFMESYRTTRHVFALPANGEAPKMITKGDGVLGSVSLNKNADRMAFTFQSLDKPVEVYTSPVADFSMARISSVNADVPKPPMGRTEKLTWKSKDGLEIEGLLTYPVNYEKGRKYPLILNVHGGPAGMYSQSFTGNPSIYMLQYFAQNGYAILRGNPRGSAGYGKDFRFANFKDWGYGDFEDIMAGVDKVIEMGVAHPDSLCLMGWSYGGYMTSFAVTKTNRFKAASMGAGLPNLVSMVTTTDIPNYLVAHMGGEFWEDYATYEKHSAIYRIKNVATPTQVIHGQRDLRVPFTQGQEFYVALSRMGVPT
ncbi:MAG: S9 family peptidase, partial [bacterium]